MISPESALSDSRISFAILAITPNVLVGWGVNFNVAIKMHVGGKCQQKVQSADGRVRVDPPRARARRVPAARAPAVVRSAPHGTHDGRAHARARRRAPVRAGRPPRRWRQPPLRHATGNLTLHLPEGRQRHRCHPRRLSTHQRVRRHRQGRHQQVQPGDQDRPGHLLLESTGFRRP